VLRAFGVERSCESAQGETLRTYRMHIALTWQASMAMQSASPLISPVQHRYYYYYHDKRGGWHQLRTYRAGVDSTAYGVLLVCRLKGENASLFDFRESVKDSVRAKVRGSACQG
jgi:hypothetical protein